ncbi:hypothetical protein C8Q74DRAFT_138961 [Fomes fomentarius]|nr:hypothetical protein C8Q74DRAFT_138961 [Fomes fomentarius]
MIRAHSLPTIFQLSCGHLRLPALSCLRSKPLSLFPSIVCGAQRLLPLMSPTLLNALRAILTQVRALLRDKTKATYHRWAQFLSILFARPTIPPGPMQSPTLYLPPEMIDEILSHLVGDCRTLCKCALVCRVWLPISTRHLHSAMEVHLRGNRYAQFVNEALRADTPPPWIPFIRTIFLYGCHPDNGLRNFTHDLAGNVPKLQTLVLEEISWTGSYTPHPSAYLAASGFSSLLALVMQRCDFPSFTAVRRLITLLPRLKTLSMVDVEWPKSSHRLSVTTTSNLPRPAIQDLTVHTSIWGMSYEPLLRWLCTTPSRYSLRYYSFDYILRNRYPGLVYKTHFLLAVAPQLEHLRLRIKRTDPLSFLLEACPSQLAALKELSIYQSAPPNWTKLGSLVQNLPCQLNRLAIETYGRAFSGSVSYLLRGLAEFDDILGTCQLALQCIDFIIHQNSKAPVDSSAAEIIHAEIQRGFPRFCARGGTQIRVIFKRNLALELEILERLTGGDM